MKGKQIKVELLLGAVLVLVVTGGSGMLIRPAAKPDQVLKARFGDVVWNHDLHARMKEIATCTVCHHTERQGTVSPKPCRDCHTLFSNQEALVTADLFMEVEEKTYSGEQGPPAMQVFHNKCMGCHDAMKAGPAGCRDCHSQSFSGTHGIMEWDHLNHARKMDRDCVTCHHKDIDATWDGDYRGCGECHLPAVVMVLDLATGIERHEEAKHGKCYACHTEYNPENDLRACKDCHEGLAPRSEAVVMTETEGEAPSLEHAIHGRCHECHNRDYRSLKPAMPIYCTDCHKPDPSMLLREGSPPVLWSHKRHAEYTEWDCNTCHHTDVPGEPHMACKSCHGKDFFAGIPTLAEALDRNCIGCHEEQDAGLTEWASLEGERDDPSMHLRAWEDDAARNIWWDHRLHAAGMAFSCRECHHNTLRENGKLSTPYLARPGTPELAGHLQDCGNCHDAQGPRPGSPAEGSDAPSALTAYRTVCTECHKRFGCGPQTWEDLLEKQRIPAPPDSRRGEDE